MKLINQASPYFVSVICLLILLITCLVIPSVGSAETLGSAQLQALTKDQIFLLDREYVAPKCRKRKILSTEVIERPRNARVLAGRMAGRWKERWNLDRCGELVPYDIEYRVDKKGGVIIRAEVATAPEPEPTGVSADLLKAAAAGDLNRIQELLTKGADIDARGKNGRTSLMLASMKGNTETVKLLLKKGSDINAKNDHGLTALNYAANKNQASVMRLLIRHGANVNQRGRTGDTPLIKAAGRGNIEAATALRDYGADVNARNSGGQTALMRAALNGQSAMVRFLLENGADAKARDKRGQSALDVAQNRKIKKLIKKAAREN